MKDIVKLILDLGDVSQDYMILIDEDLNVVWVNHKLETEGFDNKKIRGNPLKKIFKGKTEYCTQTDIKEALDKKKIVTKKRKKHEIVTLPITVSDNIFVLVISADKGTAHSDDLFETQFHSTLNAFSQPIHIIDENYNLILFNDAFKKFNKKFGISTDVIGKNVFKVFPMLPQKVKKEYEKVFKTGEVLTTEEKNEISGKQISTWTRKIPVFEDDKVVRIITIVRDVSQQKETELKYKSVFENTGSASGIFGEDHVIKSCNSAFEQLSGYKKGEIIGKMHWYDFVPEEDRKRMEKYHKQRSSHKGHPPSHYECKFIDKMGNKKIVQVNIALMSDSNKRIVSLVDITEQKQQNFEQKRVLDNMLDIITVLDLKGKILYETPSVKQVLGYEVEELIGKNVFKYIHKGDLLKATKLLKQAIKNPEKKVGSNVRFKHKDGSWLWIDFVGKPIFENKKITSVILNSREITERKKIQDKLNFHSEILENINDSVTVTDLKGNILYVNEYNARQRGEKKSSLIGKNITHYGDDPEKGATQKEILETTLKKGEWEGEVVNKTKKKEIIYHTKTKLLKNSDNKKIGIIGISHDVTEEKEILEEFKETKEKLKQRYESEKILSDISSRLINLKSQTIDKEIEELLSIIGKKNNADRAYVFRFSSDNKFMSNTHEWCAKKIKPQIKNLQNINVEKQARWFFNILKKKNKLVLDDIKDLPKDASDFKKHLLKQDIKSLLIFLIYNKNKILGFIGLDIVKKKHSWTETQINFFELVSHAFADFLIKIDNETMLKQSEEKFRNLFETIDLGVVYQNAKGEILSANPTAEKILGLSLDQMQGRTSLDKRWKAVDENKNDLPGEKHPAMIALKTKKKVKDFVQGIYNPKKEDYVWLVVNSVPQFKKGSNNPFQVYSTFLDITKQKNAEKEREKLNWELKQRISELERFQRLTVGRELRMVELKKKIKELEKKLENDK